MPTNIKLSLLQCKQLGSVGKHAASAEGRVCIFCRHVPEMHVLDSNLFPKTGFRLYIYIQIGYSSELT